MATCAVLAHFEACSKLNRYRPFCQSGFKRDRLSGPAGVPGWGGCPRLANLSCLEISLEFSWSCRTEKCQKCKRPLRGRQKTNLARGLPESTSRTRRRPRLLPSGRLLGHSQRSLLGLPAQVALE